MISEMLLQCHTYCAKTYQILSPVLFSAILGTSWTTTIGSKILPWDVDCYYDSCYLAPAGSSVHVWM